MAQFIGNYTGPNWSDGKYQESVPFGESDPLSELDKLSRLHDSAYWRFKGQRAYLDAADMIYERDAKTLVGKFPELAGNAVLYGNYANRQSSQLGDDLLSYGPIGAAVFAGRNARNAMRMIDGTYLDKEKRAVEEYYNTDPRKGQAAVTFNYKPKTPNYPEKASQHLLTKEQAAKVTSTVSSVKTKAGGILKKFGELVGSVKKQNTVVPESIEQRNKRLVQSQKEKLEHYNEMYLRAQLKPTKPRKYKKKKHNLIKAIRVLPAHCIH